MSIRTPCLFLLLLICGPVHAQEPTCAFLELRLFEGFRDTGALPAFSVHPLELDPDSAHAIGGEERSLKEIFQLDRVFCRSQLEFWIPEKSQAGVSRDIQLHQNEMVLEITRLPEAENRFLLVVKDASPGKPPAGSSLLTAQIHIPEGKRAVLGFKDRERHICFISLGRNPNQKEGPYRSIEGHSVLLPRLLQKVSPDYPPTALSQGVEGMVVAEATASAQGKLVQVHILSGPDVLGEALSQSLKHWHYRPFIIDGRREPLRVLIHCHFILSRPGQDRCTPEELHVRTDRFWSEHQPAPWPDPARSEPVTPGVNQRLIEILAIEGIPPESS